MSRLNKVASSLVVLACAGGGVLWASSASATSASVPAPSVDVSQFPSRSVLTDEYTTAIASMPRPLPPGDAFPPDLPNDIAPSSTVRYEKGIGLDHAWFTWLCAWEGEYLKDVASSNDAEAEISAGNIEAWPSTTFFKAMVDDPDQGWVTNVVKPMLAGDASGVQNDYSSMCDHYPVISK